MATRNGIRAPGGEEDLALGHTFGALKSLLHDCFPLSGYSAWSALADYEGLVRRLDEAFGVVPWMTPVLPLTRDALREASVPADR